MMSTGGGQQHQRPARETDFTAIGKVGRKTGISVPDTGQRDPHGFELMNNFFSPSPNPQKSLPAIPDVENAMALAQSIASQALQSPLLASNSFAPLNGFSTGDNDGLYSESDVGSLMDVDSGSGPEPRAFLNQQASVSNMTNAKRQIIPRARSPFKTNPHSDVQNTPPRRASSVGLATSTRVSDKSANNPLRSSPIRSSMRRTHSQDERGNLNMNVQLDFHTSKGEETVIEDGNGRDTESPLLKPPKRLISGFTSGPERISVPPPALQEKLPSLSKKGGRKEKENSTGIEESRKAAAAQTEKPQTQAIVNNLQSTHNLSSPSASTINGTKPSARATTLRASAELGQPTKPSKTVVVSSPSSTAAPFAPTHHKKRNALGSLAVSQKKPQRHAITKAKSSKVFNLSNLDEYDDIAMDLDLNELDGEFEGMPRNEAHGHEHAEEDGDGEQAHSGIDVEKLGNALGVGITKHKARKGAKPNVKGKGDAKTVASNPEPQEEQEEGKERESIPQADHETDLGESEYEQMEPSEEQNQPRTIPLKSKATSKLITSSKAKYASSKEAAMAHTEKKASMLSNKFNRDAEKSKPPQVLEKVKEAEKREQDGTKPESEISQKRGVVSKGRKGNVPVTTEGPAVAKKSLGRSPESKITKPANKAKRRGTKGKKNLDLASEGEEEEENEFLEIEVDVVEGGEEQESPASAPKGKRIGQGAKAATSVNEIALHNKLKAKKTGITPANAKRGQDKKLTQPASVEEQEVEEENLEPVIKPSKGKGKAPTSPSIKSKANQRGKKAAASDVAEEDDKQTVSVPEKKGIRGKRIPELEPESQPQSELEPVIPGPSKRGAAKTELSLGGRKTKQRVPDQPEPIVGSPATASKRPRRGRDTKGKTAHVNADLSITGVTAQEEIEEETEAAEREPPQKKVRKSKDVPLESQSKDGRSKGKEDSTFASVSSQGAPVSSAVGARQTIRIEKPIPRAVSVDDDGKRRSQRTRIEPLKWWAGERVTYGKSTKRDSVPGLALPEIREIIKIDDIQPLKKTKRSAAPAEPVATATKKGKAGNKRKRYESEGEVGDDGNEIEDEPEDWEGDGRLRGLLKSRDPTEDDAFEEYDLAYSRSRLRTNEVANASFKMCKTYSMEHFGTGFIDLPPGGIKRMKTSGKYDLVFLVLSGKVRVDIGTNQFKIRKGCQFQVPRGNLYSIDNVYDTPASIFFAQGCEVASPN